MSHPYKSQSKTGVERAKERYAGGGAIRSERTEFEKARRLMRRTPPVTIMEDIIGSFDEAKGQNNALRDDIRRGASQKMKETGYDPLND